MIGAWLAAGPVLAQEAPPAGRSASPTNLDSIKVTARKREETLQEVPVAVTAFTSEALDRMNVQDISDLDAQVPNLTIYAARGASSTVTAYIRGIGQSDPTWGADPGVGIYLDDVYIARPQGALLDVFDVSRIEVLRGPQGTLYGKNTIGGAIKYISRGLPTQTEGFAQITVGNYSQLDAKAAIGGPIGGADSGLRARVAVASMNHDGFGENTVNGQPVSDKQVNAARLNLGAYAGDDFDVQFALDWIDDQSGMRGSKMLAPNPFLRPYPPMDSRYDIRSGMRNLNNVETKGASATVNWRPNEDIAVKYVVAKRESDSEANIDFDTTPVKLADVSGTYNDNQVSNEVQLNYDAGGRVRGVVGLYQFSGEAGGQIQNNYFSAQFADNQGKVLTDSIALYADWTFDLTSRLKLDVGARYTDEDKRAIVLNRLYADPGFSRPVAVTADFDKKTNFTNVSPKVSLDYQITPDIMVYGLATRGFKSGGYNIRANAVAVPRSAEPFDDETVDSYEVGSKMAFLDQRLFLNLSAFYNKYKDIQLSVFTGLDTNGDGIDDSFFGDFTNAGAGTVKGLEVEYQYLPTQHWLISGNLAWLDTKYDEYLDRGVNVAPQMKFTNAPEFSGALNVEYRTELANGSNLSARVSYSYQSEVWPTTDLSPVIRQDGYGLVNAGVIWRLDDAWTFSLQGTNLTDKEYRTTGYNIPAVGTLIGFYGPPRQYSLSVRYDF
ncbi:TonB-dependent receptor [Stenotrophomonas maltophilia]|uniref:TonB-dependent receptor n=1 Tax=Stenotrophomonas maltophilia TaxID=40324 RepID=UPI0006AA41DD|nr:TonB-dependent receptor [Stenotrophomonas maltophilia]ALA82638.1 TonB-dependent receptor [Stenotrophomonas maltophilia]MBH1475878.1 TonB-dependent receptor [Stenotrophomonas maltophilia]MBH1501514.1 TonB-dependent receptor [Stenotrophomonas maltophilia]MBH1784725.1 TonB-dependent receptor [Stenotrophomonas maltophilia]